MHFSYIIPLDPLEYQVPNEAADLILILLPPFLLVIFLLVLSEILAVAGFDSVTVNVS